MYPKVGCNRLTKVTRHVNMLYKIRNISVSAVLSLWPGQGLVSQETAVLIVSLDR
jgi:hypothetical protein